MERDAELLTVRDFMNAKVKSLPHDMNIVDALAQLRNWGFSGAPVVNDDGVVVGVLSELDCMRVLSSAAFYSLPNGPVSSEMTTSVDTLSPSQDLFMSAQLFQKTGHRRFPVVENGHLVGIVTLRDIDRALWEVAQQRSIVPTAPKVAGGAAWDEQASRARDRKR